MVFFSPFFFAWKGHENMISPLQNQESTGVKIQQ
jgi:hypothetical protein